MNHVFGVIMYDLKHGHGKLEEIEDDPDEVERRLMRLGISFTR
jgi:hypothetical protein